MAGRAFKKLLLVSSVVMGGFGPPVAAPVWAASGDRIGESVVITNVVMADFAEKQRKLAKGDDVRQDETIEVNTDAQGEFRLDDDTKLALGPGSRLVLDKFVYDGDKKVGSIVINMMKGAFRFITGAAAKSTYVINTPNASITVRGTVFDVYILPDRSVWVLLHEGALEATGKRNVCHVLDQPGQLIRISDDGTVAAPVNWPKLPDNATVAFDTAFPFVTNAPAIDPNPILTRAMIVDGAFPPSEEKACLNPHPRFGVKKADTVPRRTAPPAKKKNKVVQKQAKPKRTASRPRNDDDDWGNGARGMDIVIGGGIRFPGRGGYGGGGGNTILWLAGNNAACQRDVRGIAPFFQARYSKRSFSSWQHAAGVQVVPVRVCAQIKAALNRAASSNASIGMLRGMAASDPLISASLSRTRHGAGDVLGVGQQNGMLTVYVF